MTKHRGSIIIDADPSPDTNMLRLAIIIVNYKTPDLVVDCIDSIHHQLDPDLDRIIVVDNCSGDGSLEKIKDGVRTFKNSQCIRFIASERNGGFSAGNNQGIKSVDAEYYFLLNSDTYDPDDSITKLLVAIAKKPDVLIFHPALISPSGSTLESCFRFHSPIFEFIHPASNRLIQDLLSYWWVGNAFRTEYGPDWVSFAAIVFKKEVFEQVGYLDEEFFMYFEDIDFCLRTNQASIRIELLPNIRFVHLEGASSNISEQNKNLKPLPSYFYESRSRYYAKHYGGVLGLLAANLCWLSGRTISLFREVLFGRQPFIPKGHAKNIWTNFFNPFKKSSKARG